MCGPACCACDGEIILACGLVKIVPAVAYHLPQLAYNILATTYKDYFPAQYTRTDMYEKAVMHAYWEVAAERGKGGGGFPLLREGRNRMRNELRASRSARRRRRRRDAGMGNKLAGLSKRRERDMRLKWRLSSRTEKEKHFEKISAEPPVVLTDLTKMIQTLDSKAASFGLLCLILLSRSARTFSSQEE